MKRLSVTLLVLLAGCAGYTPKPLDSAAKQAAFESRRLDSPEIRQFLERSLGHEIAPWPPSWDLTTLTLAAIFFQPDIDTAQARKRIAEAAIVTAGARPNPTIGVSIQRNADAPAGQSPWTNGVRIDIPIETAGKRDYRIERARHLAQAAKLREAETLWQVRSRVRATLLASYPTEALARRLRDLRAEIARLLERRFELGYASQPELTQARLALGQATLALRENQKRRAENLVRVAAAVGVPAAALQGSAISFEAFDRTPPPCALPPADARHQALLQRPDVLAALADYAASQSALELEIARQYPDVSLGPGFSWDQGALKWSLGLSLVLPLLNRNEGPIAEAEARREQAAATFRSVQASAIADVDRALAGYVHAARMSHTADALLRDRQRNERAADVAFNAGEADRLAWLSAQLETAAAEMARVDVLSQAQQTLGLLEDALRRPVGGGETLPVTPEQALSARQLRSGEPP